MMHCAARNGVFDQSKRKQNFYLNEKYFFWHFFHYAILLTMHNELIFD